MSSVYIYIRHINAFVGHKLTSPNRTTMFAWCHLFASNQAYETQFDLCARRNHNSDANKMGLEHCSLGWYYPAIHDRRRRTPARNRRDRILAGPKWSHEALEAIARRAL